MLQNLLGSVNTCGRTARKLQRSDWREGSGNFPVMHWRQTHPWRTDSLSLQMTGQCLSHNRICHSWLSEAKFWRLEDLAPAHLVQRAWQLQWWLQPWIAEGVYSDLLAGSVPFSFLEGPQSWRLLTSVVSQSQDAGVGVFWEVLPYNQCYRCTPIKIHCLKKQNVKDICLHQL